jgi:hypothetical protein
LGKEYTVEKFSLARKKGPYTPPLPRSPPAFVLSAKPRAQDVLIIVPYTVYQKVPLLKFY